MLMEIRVAGVLRMLVRSFRKQSLQSQSLLSGAGTWPLKPLEESKKRPERDSGDLYAGMPAPDPEKKVTPSKDIFADPPAKEDLSLAIFLDIDGVLRKLESVPMITVNGGTLPLDLGNRALLPEALRALKYLIHLTGASLVVSSEWRRSSSLLEEAQTALRALGMRVRGVTPVLRPREDLFVGTKLDPDKQATLRLRWAERRAREITAWLQEHREVRHWIALDDLDLTIADEAAIRSADTLKMGPFLVLVDPEVGLTMSHARQSSEWLLAKKERPRKMART